VFTLLLNGLREVHTNNLLHLDIKPSNIYIRNDGSPVLIDFGAARQTPGEEAMRLNPMYTPGFASPEHYRRRELLGPWSDIYGVGASMFSCLAAAAPRPPFSVWTTTRTFRPEIVGSKCDQLSETIDWCLRLDHLEQPQSVFALRKC
jgi:serine/threonine protein kinase